MRIGQYVELSELAAAPVAPAVGRRRLYALASGLFYRDSAGTQIGPLAAAGGGGAATINMVEVDVGVLQAFYSTVNVTNAAITATTKVHAVQAGEAATGRQADENEMEQFSVNVSPKAGSMLVNLAALPGSSLQGKVKIYYMTG